MTGTTESIGYGPPTIFDDLEDHNCASTDLHAATMLSPKHK